MILKSEACCEIPSTQDQAKSDQWHFERRFRVTASTCKSIVNLGEKLSKHDSMQPHFASLDKKLWFPTNFSNFHTEYGKRNEVNALIEYGKEMNVSFFE